MPGGLDRRRLEGGDLPGDDAFLARRTVKGGAPTIAPSSTGSGGGTHRTSSPTTAEAAPYPVLWLTPVRHGSALGPTDPHRHPLKTHRGNPGMLTNASSSPSIPRRVPRPPTPAVPFGDLVHPPILAPGPRRAISADRKLGMEEAPTHAASCVRRRRRVEDSEGSRRWTGSNAHAPNWTAWRHIAPRSRPWPSTPSAEAATSTTSSEERPWPLRRAPTASRSSTERCAEKATTTVRAPCSPWRSWTGGATERRADFSPTSSALRI